MNKHIVAALMVTVLLPAFGEEGRIDENALGTWRHFLTQSISVIIRDVPGHLDITVESIEADKYGSEFYLFEADGTGLISGPDYKIPILWTLDGSTLRVTHAAGEHVTTEVHELFRVSQDTILSVSREDPRENPSLSDFYQHLLAAAFVRVPQGQLDDL